MLRKIWNTLRYGDGRTKRFLITVMILGLASVGFIVAAIVTLSPLFWIATVATALITAAMAKDVKLAVVQDNVARDSMDEEEWQEELERRKEEKKQKKEAKKKKKGKLSPEELAAEAAAREEEDEKEFRGNALVNMTEEKLKKLFVRYKVKQEHVPVVIDLCIPEHIRQAPGFAWVDGGLLKVLLIEGKPRMIERPLSALQVMEVERGIAVRAANEYVELRETDLMKKVFTPYLPRYHKKEIGGRTVLLKNLYVLDEEIKFTSPSVNELKKLFSFRIEIMERRLQEGNISPYYKELFVSSFLWQDGILTLKEYQQEVERVLTSLASPSISEGEFEMTLSAMINSGLLPAEYRKFALDKREARKNGTEENKGKKKKRK
ncbi:MAG: hypothetical protein IJW37_02980 [Lachnospiraceae bacterium]|nr:hypothetical protein [Lachnospiraceae bacterium]